MPDDHIQPRASRTSIGSLDDATHPSTLAGRPSLPGLDYPENSTLDPAHPREWHAPVVTLSSKVFGQLLGLNPFKTSYFGMYRVLDRPVDRFVALTGAVFAIAAGVPLPLIGVIFGELISSFPPSEHQLEILIGRLLGVAAAYFVVTALYATAFGFTAEKITMKTRERLFECLLHLDTAYLDTHDVDVHSLLSEKVDSIHAGCSEKAGIFIQSISYFVAAFTVGFMLSPRLTGILLAAVIPSLVLITATTRHYGSKHSSKVADLSSAANAVVESAIRSVKVVQAFGMMDRICSDHAAYLSEKTRASVKKAVVAAAQVGAIYFLAYSVNGLAFYVGSRMAQSGERGGNAGTIFAVVLLILDSSMVVAQFAPFLEIFAQAASAQEAILRLYEVRQKSATSARVTLPSPDLMNKSVNLREVSFTYPARPGVKALNDLNLTIKPASFTALVGTSGGGKSTLVSLLTGTYPYLGSIRIGRHELRDLDPVSVRSQLAVVEQEHVLFSGTIHDNICHGVRSFGLSTDEVNRRCRIAVEDARLDFLDTLPNGLNTTLGDGLQLSGGQMQRICLARALIRRPSILILDEPTSALDARSEVAIMSAIKSAATSGITVLMVAHRLSTVLDADAIAVFSDGQVVEYGTPEQLSKSDGVFKSLLAAQNTGLIVVDDVQDKSDLFATVNMRDSSQSSLELKEADVEEQGSPAANSTVTAKHIMRQVILNLKPDAWRISIGLFASLLSGGILLGEAIIFGNLVELLNNGVRDVDFQRHANFYCLMFFVVGCVGLISWVGSGTAFGVASTRSVDRIQRRLLATIISLDMEWFAAPGRSVQHLMSAFTKDSGDLSCLSGPALGTIFTTTTSVVGGIILALCTAWKIAVVLLAAVPVMLAAGFVRLKVLERADSRRRSAYKHATGLASEACRYRNTVTLYGLEAHIIREYRTALLKPYREGRLSMVTSNVVLAISLSITYFVYALAYWWGSKQVRNGTYSGKQFFTVLPAMLFSAQSAGQLFNLSPEIARARAAAASIFTLLSSPVGMLKGPLEMVSNKARSHRTLDSVKLQPKLSSKPEVPKISFSDVAFSYPGSTGNAVLRSVSLDIYSKQSVAFVGPSGAGKSSTVSLIERFYDVTRGAVNFDGTDVRNMEVSDLRQQVGLVSQDPELLPGSIAHNIKLGSLRGQEVTDSEIEAACKKCGLHEFITSLPEGYNTECGTSTSSKLSGGQRQRVALARALIRNPEILLLDEPTSALDAHSEQHIQEALAEAAKGRTTLIVAHRLASIKDSDQIYVFDEGTIVDHGTHDELVARGGLYASMAKAQSIV